MKYTKKNSPEQKGPWYKQLYYKYRSIVDIVLNIIFLIALISVMGSYGLLGYAALWFVWGIYKVYKNWSSIRIVIDGIETMLFTKPLRKEYWKKGEFKKLQESRKIKFVWRKKDVKDKKRA